MKSSVLRFLLVLMASVSVGLLGTLGAGAQEKKKLSYRVSAENTKYTQQHTIDVGDVPGHQIRIYEIHRVFPNDTVSYDGVQVKEQWVRAYSDYTDLNGPATAYTVTMLENGDKIFSRGELISQTVTNPDGSRRTTSLTVSRFTGGTGKFLGIQGTSKSVTTSDIKAGINENQVETEYWIAK